MKIKLVELAGLNEDLSHMISEKINITVKMDIYKVIQKNIPIIESYDKLKLDFFKLNGIEKDGMFTLKADLTKEVLKELDDLNNKEEEVKLPFDFSIMENIVNEHPYLTLIRLFSE